MDLGLRGRRALVTGASSGMAKAIAAMLVDEGAVVAISSRSAGRIAAAASDIGAVAGLVWDSRDLPAAAALVSSAQRALGGAPGIVVISTGGPPATDPLVFDTAEWEAAHRTLVLAPLTLLDLVLPTMRAQGWGRVVNLSSTAVRVPLRHRISSTGERSSILAALKLMSSEVAADGVTINTILPGRVLTDRLLSTAATVDDLRAAAAREVPVARVGRVEEIAAAATFLCSVQASYITGVALPVDGGLLPVI